jgi:hypothetical protein
LNLDAVPVGHQTADGGVDAQAALGVRERLL